MCKDINYDIYIYIYAMECIKKNDRDLYVLTIRQDQ